MAHQYKSAVTSKKLHKIYIDVATTYTQIITQLLASKFHRAQIILSHNDAITQAQINIS